MDPITQGALGAVWAQCGTRGASLKRATWIGIFGGMLADIDVLIRSSSDSLLALSRTGTGALHDLDDRPNQLPTSTS